MTDESKPQPLDYLGPAPERMRIPEEPEARRWRYRRVLFRIGLVVVVSTITIHFGTNLFMFGKLTALTPADFVPEVERLSVPTVRAIKEYQRDTGHLPNRIEDLVVPGYLASTPSLAQDIENGQFTQWTLLNHFIIYNFTPGAEGWTVRGRFANGPIPVPPVKIAPATPPR